MRSDKRGEPGAGRLSDREAEEVVARLRAMSRAAPPWDAARDRRIWARVAAGPRRPARWRLAGTLASAVVLILALLWSALRPPAVSAHAILAQALAATLTRSELAHTTIESTLSPLVVADPGQAGTRRIETWGDPPRAPFRVEEYDDTGRLRFGVALEAGGEIRLFDGRRVRVAQLTAEQMEHFSLPASPAPSIQTTLQQHLAAPAVENRGLHDGVWELRTRSQGHYPGFSGQIETVLRIDAASWQFRELSEWRLDGPRELLRRVRLLAHESLPPGSVGDGDAFSLAVPAGTPLERVAPEALNIPLPITLDELARDPRLTARILPERPGGPVLRAVVPTGLAGEPGAWPSGYILEYRWPDGRGLALVEQPGPPGGERLPPEFEANPIQVPGAVAGWREEGDAFAPQRTALVLYTDGTTVIVLAERLPPDELGDLVRALQPLDE